MPAAERQREPGPDAGSSASGFRITGRMGIMSRPERALTRVWQACGGRQTATPEPRGKLDTKNGTPGAAAPAPVPVNGPEDGLPGWDQVDWGQAEENVRRLRQRIFAASRDGDLKKARSLQKLTAPRGALSYPRLSREEFEGRFLGLMPYLDLKSEGNNSMAGN